MPSFSSSALTEKAKRCVAAYLVAATLTFAAPAQAEELYQYLEEGVLVLSNMAPTGGRRSLRIREENGVTRLTLRDTEQKRALRRALPEAYRALLEEACEHHDIPFALALAVMEVESNFDPDARSKAGAQGLMQLMPATAADMDVQDPFDPRQNIFGGVRYLRYLTDLFDGDLARIIAAYNAGPNAVNKAGGVPNYPETKAYLSRVLALFEHYKTLSLATSNPSQMTR